MPAGVGLALGMSELPMGSSGPDSDEVSGSYATVSAMRLLIVQVRARHFFSRRSHELYNSHREAGSTGR